MKKLDKKTKEQVMEFINKGEWVFAKTYAETAPHEYIHSSALKTDQEKKNFKVFVKVIEDYGYTKYFYKKPFKYLDIKNKKYWHMGKEGDEVINRDDKNSSYE